MTRLAVSPMSRELETLQDQLEQVLGHIERQFPECAAVGAVGPRPEWPEPIREARRLIRMTIEGLYRITRAAPSPDDDTACTVCGGSGDVLNPGYYVPGEQFCEPPFREPCAACVGTGMREVQDIYASLVLLRGERDDLADELRKAHARLVDLQDYQRAHGARDGSLDKFIEHVAAVLADLAGQGGEPRCLSVSS